MKNSYLDLVRETIDEVKELGGTLLRFDTVDGEDEPVFFDFLDTDFNASVNVPPFTANNPVSLFAAIRHWVRKDIRDLYDVDSILVQDLGGTYLIEVGTSEL